MAYLRRVRCKRVYHSMGLHLLKPTSMDDFEPVEAKVPVDNPVSFFRAHGRDFFVCCADFQTRALVLVKPKEMLTFKGYPFFREALRRQAEELLVIPFSQLAGVAAEVAEDVAHVNTIFVHITLRCGSTLLIKALEASGQMHTLSESDVYANISRYVLSKKAMPEDVTEMLLELIRHINTLFNYSLLQTDPSKTITCYKMRGQVFLIADLLRKALPEVKTVLLYRNLLGTVDSWAHVMAERSYWKYWLITALRLDSFYLNNLLHWAPNSPWDNPVFRCIPVPHGVVWLATFIWLEYMQKAHELTKTDAHQCFDVILRYEELCKHKEEMVAKVIESLGIQCVDEDTKLKIREVFGFNSQAGHSLASRGPGRGESWLGQWETGIISKILDHVNYEEISRPDFVLNGTMTQI
ncbi:uncharacterized protein LOC118404694 [Branchiostoma floridae]|uniref:Uncharacterized protein LOC118404694 n=1 Tax=Branchiostoma floridae TaxID=7739 RepID=C3ZST5_BRAFL|nr:uncharacterized protein LOC118404694 [Branchiostoma floridae]XP_035659838.1 uncharacterized protein LOC118404694 [Branchiostoma floridae]|eukprot:XP_002588476.1 hypothetical protein BRAFLDRAFT_63425 [Branchiostoma floridae]